MDREILQRFRFDQCVLCDFTSSLKDTTDRNFRSRGTLPASPSSIVSVLIHGRRRELTFISVTAAYRLSMWTFAFQEAAQRGMQSEDRIVIDKCFELSVTVINGMIKDLAPSGYMRYSSEGYFIFATYASAFLAKVSVTKAKYEGRLIELMTLAAPEAGIFETFQQETAHANVRSDRATYPNI